MVYGQLLKFSSEWSLSFHQSSSYGHGTNWKWKSRHCSDNLKLKSVNCWFHRSSFKGFSIVFLFSDWLKVNHPRSRIERGLLDIFSRHICSAVTESMRVTNYATKFWREKMFRKPSSKLLRWFLIRGTNDEIVQYLLIKNWRESLTVPSFTIWVNVNVFFS